MASNHLCAFCHKEMREVASVPDTDAGGVPGVDARGAERWQGVRRVRGISLARVGHPGMVAAAAGAVRARCAADRARVYGRMAAGRREAGCAVVE